MDFASHELRRGGLKIRLQDQPFQVLALLLENPGQVVSRDDLRRKLWPSDTFVDFDNGLNTAINKIREALGDSADHPKFIETLPRRGYRFLQTLEHKTEKSIDTIVVLPLENLSRDPEQEYFAEGITEALINTLAKIGALRVVSRTTAMHYKGVHRPLREIAGELQVGAVVEGTVLRSDDRVRISAQLIDARTDTHLWADSYERDLRDVLALQSDVAQAIARQIQVKLTPHERANLAHARTVDPEAFEAYLKGRYHWNRRSGEGLDSATHYFKQAVAKDPNYAAAYSGLADCANIAGWYGYVAPKIGGAQAKAAAQKALELDDLLSEAHCSMGWSLVNHDFDLVAGENEYHRALELNPNNPTAVEWHALVLMIMGLADEAEAEIDRAVRLDPLSPLLKTIAGEIAYYTSRNEKCQEMCRAALQLDPNFSIARWTIAASYVQQGKLEEAIAESEDLVRITKRAPFYVFVLGHCYGSAGRRQEALRLVEELQAISKARYVPQVWSAIIHASLGAKDDAIRYLEAAYREREVWMIYIRGFPWLRNLHGDPRFEDLVLRMNYPQNPRCGLAAR